MKHIVTNAINEITVDSENANFPVTRVLDEHPKLVYKAADGVVSAVMETEITGGVSDIMLAGTNASGVSITATDPNEMSWGGNDTWGGLSTGTIAAIEAILAASTSIVSVCRYDTSEDSDGGAWRKRCQNLSWYNETLGTSTRGVTREFPSIALIVAETDTVTIYDATDPSLPMWMVFSPNSSNMLRSETSTGSVVMLNGVLSIGSYDTRGCSIIVFLSDSSRSYIVGQYGQYNSTIADRDLLKGYVFGFAPGLVDNVVNDVAMTIPSDAPIDPETGIQVPTIKVETDNGTSIIDGTAGVGTVVDASAGKLLAGDIDTDMWSVKDASGDIEVWNNIPTTDAVAADYTYTNTTSPAILGNAVVMA